MDNVNQHILLVAGPCAAENEEQVLTTARAIKDLLPSLQEQVQTPLLPVFRAGLWKPRTSPHSFQGVGAVGLEWLRQVHVLTGMWTATEVATAEQTQQTIDAGIDMLWIGARTSANPQQVQIIAETIRQHAGNLKAIMVKNPMHDDVALWQGNIERLQAAGLPIIAIHRGCGHHSHWRMAHDLRKNYPSLPLLLDPSHMSGNRNMVPTLCRKGAELGYNGWMIEVHPTPDNAMSDAQQQIVPDVLKECIFQPQQCDDLIWLRAQMDEVDDELWQTILQRMEVSREIGKYKSVRGMDVVQPKRFEAILRYRLQWAENNGLHTDTVEQMMNALHTESIRQQQ